MKNKHESSNVLRNELWVRVPIVNHFRPFFHSKSSSEMSVGSIKSDASLENNIELRGLGGSDSPSVMMCRSFSQASEPSLFENTKELMQQGMLSMVEIQSISHSPSEVNGSDVSESVVESVKLSDQQEMDIPVKIPFSFLTCFFYCFYGCCTPRRVSADISFQEDVGPREVTQRPTHH